MIQSNNNSNASWPRAEADGEPLIRMKTRDRATPDLAFTAGIGELGVGVGVRISHFQKKKKKRKINDNILGQ